MPIILQNPSPLSTGGIESIHSLLGSAICEMRVPNVAAVEQTHELPSESRIQFNIICAHLKVNRAWILGEWTFDDLHVPVTNVDSMLITIECIDKIINFCRLKP